MTYNSPEHVAYWTKYWADLADYEKSCKAAAQSYKSTKGTK